MARLILVGAAALLAVAGVSRLLPAAPPPDYPVSTRDRFDADSNGLHSLDAMLAKADHWRNDNSQKAMADAIASVVEGRFRHGYSQFGWRDNAYLVLLDRVTGHGVGDPEFSAPVRPSEIVSYDTAACSQQAMVMQAMLAQRGITFASVGWGGDRGGHFAVAAYVDGVWRYYDPNMEIGMQGVPIDDIRYDPSLLRAMYEHSIKPSFGPVLEDYARGKGGRMWVTGVNTNPAPRATLLHAVTAWALLKERATD